MIYLLTIVQFSTEGFELGTFEEKTFSQILEKACLTYVFGIFKQVYYIEIFCVQVRDFSA